MLLLVGSGFGGGGGGGVLSIGVDIGLHERSFRDTLIEVAHTVAVWPLSETRGTTFRDITGNGHHGTWFGSGLVHGVPFGLAEGSLGVTVDGNQYGQVPDDSAANANLNLSLANGDINQSILIKTTHNSGTLRCIMCKQVTNSSGNGWFLGLQNGQIVFFLRVSGSTIFNFSRGSVADGLPHLITPVYATTSGTGEAWIEIDGVQSGAKVTGVTTEPAVTSAPMRFFMFTDGVAGDGSGFIGSACYGMVGREGVSIGAALEARRHWTSVLTDTRSSVPMTIEYGIPSSSPLDNTARTGTCRLALDNSTGNVGGLLGHYSFDHPNCRTGFRKGSPLRVAFTWNGVPYYKHVGRIISALPTPGTLRERLSMVTSVDWMDIAANSRLSLPARTNAQSDDVMGAVIDEALRPPHAVAISDGVEAFDYALDIGRGRFETILSEGSRICTSERGFLYVKGDTVTGGVVTFESRADRQIDTAVAASFDNTMQGLEPDDSPRPNVINVTSHPRTVDAAATTVLFAMTARQPIAPGETLIIRVDYRDPNQTVDYVGGIDMQDPTANTDYTMTSNEDGTGVDLTSFVAIDEDGDDLGGSSAQLTVTNNSPSFTGWFTTQLRGKGVYHRDPVTTPVFDEATVRRDGPEEAHIDLAYISSLEFAKQVGEHVLATYESGRTREISFIANASTTLITQALEREVGDRIGVIETMQSGTVEHAYVINHVRLEVMNGANGGVILKCTWTLVPQPTASGNVWVLGVVGASELDETTVLGL